MRKVALYANSIRYLKWEQLWHQATKRIGLDCPLVRTYKPTFNTEMLRLPPAITELDYDLEFLGRFSVDELMHNEITLLHSTESVDLDGTWFFGNRSPLWNHNLHYFEYLFALAKQYETTNKQEYIEKIKKYISSWIKNNPLGIKNSAWECYPIALRLPNWIELYSILHEEIDQDNRFKDQFIRSLFEQYSYLLNHLEKHLLANHYFEDLKAIIIASVFFGDDKVRAIATEKLVEQCHEQIFEDGMQYERSPMYQKILLEDLIRVEVALECVNQKNEIVRRYIKKMLDVAYSLEIGLDRLPLFNDCGRNITKSLNALVEACKKRFGIQPEKGYSFPDSGFYAFEFGEGWKLIVDGGQPGPDYSPGHAHSEMMSFELFYKGKPIIVNCGTYAYQCNQRMLFKSTQASNTVKISGTEQSECWSSFRMARRARLCEVKLMENGIILQMIDYQGHNIRRAISIQKDCIEVVDESRGENIESFVHFAKNEDCNRIVVSKGQKESFQIPYAEEFGVQEIIQAIKIHDENSISYKIVIKEMH